jgi:hypothetical protein
MVLRRDISLLMYLLSYCMPRLWHISGSVAFMYIPHQRGYEHRLQLFQS